MTNLELGCRDVKRGTHAFSAPVIAVYEKAEQGLPAYVHIPFSIRDIRSLGVSSLEDGNQPALFDANGAGWIR